VKGDWLVPMPHGLDARTAMVIGTAGFTAALCVLELEREQVRPDTGEVVVTGATGGVGAIAVALLAKAGFKVVASTGKAAEHAWLTALGAKEIVDRSPFVPGAKGPLDKGRFAGAVDTVGGATLAGLLKTMAPGGTVTAVGNAGGVELHTSVFPFILRGVKLVGVDSVTVPYERRVRAWKRLATDLSTELLAALATEIGLDEVPEAAERLVQGQGRGRIIVDPGR
jgi:acrylyl-CoA reductase (NADPH)